MSVLTWTAPVNNHGCDLIFRCPWGQRKWYRLINRQLDITNMKVEAELGIQKHDLISILDFLTLLSVLVAGHDLKIDAI